MAGGQIGKKLFSKPISCRRAIMKKYKEEKYEKTTDAMKTENKNKRRVWMVKVFFLCFHDSHCALIPLKMQILSSF